MQGILRFFGLFKKREGIRKGKSIMWSIEAQTGEQAD